MKIALLTFYTGDHYKIADVVRENKDGYCKKRGYDHIEFKGPYNDGTLYYAIDRLFYLRDILKNYDTIWVLNVQSIITNYNKKIEDLLEDGKDFVISADVGGLNAGSFIIKNSQWSFKWLDFLCKKSPLNPTEHWGNHWEQKIIQSNYQNIEWINNIKIVSQNEINSYIYSMYPPWNNSTPGDWRSGDRVLAFPGQSLEKRLIEVPKHFDRVIK